LTILFFNTFNVLSQADCSELVSKKYDKFEKRTDYKAKIELKNGYKSPGYQIKIMGSSLSKKIISKIIVDNIYDERFLQLQMHPITTHNLQVSYITFLFRDDESYRLDMDVIGGYPTNTCYIWDEPLKYDKRELSIYRLKVLNKLLNSKLSAIRIDESAEKYDYEINDAESERILKIFNCFGY